MKPPPTSATAKACAAPRSRRAFWRARRRERQNSDQPPRHRPTATRPKPMLLRDCCNFHDFRELARRRLPGPIFDYIDGGADDEVTLRQNSASFERCDLVPNVLRGVEAVDMSVT